MVAESPQDNSWRKKLAMPGILAASLLLSMIVVNPFHEMLSEDDGWAYARTVQNLLATGRYHLDGWAAANMPVQVYLAAGLSKLAGYSLSTLRCTTLALLAVAIGSFYLLLRELSRTREEAGVLTLGLLASPIVLMLSFTFMSDIQFLGWFLLALWLYVRGLRNQSIVSMILGSLAAGCAIGTRQFGVAMIGGLVLSWLLSRRERRPSISLMLAGLIVPVLAAAAQFHMGLATPNVTQAYRLAEQHLFLSHSITALLQESFWRCCVMLQYLGMSVLPVLPLIVVRQRRGGQRHSGGWLSLSLVMLLTCAAIVVALSMSSFFTARPEARHHGIWEPLELYWLLPTQLGQVRIVMRLLDLCGILGAAALVGTGFRSLQRLRATSGNVTPEKILLAGTVAGMLALHLTYVQLNDTYLASIIPFAMLIVAEGLQGRETPKTAWTTSAALSIAVILITSMWVQGEYSRQFAAWKAADDLVEVGVRPADIAAPLQWAEYHGAFDDWVAAGSPGIKAPYESRPLTYDPFHDPFEAWLKQRDEGAQYRLIYAPDGRPPTGWQLVNSQSYRNHQFAKHFLWTWKRDPIR